MAVTAVIAAAGSGQRLGAGVPKAFVPLAGRPMIEWSLDAFAACESVVAVVVAAPPEMVDEASSRLQGIREAGSGGGPRTLVDGGATRARSVANALAAVETELVAIHDAARPVLTPGLVEELVARLEADPEAAAVIAAAPVTDTIKRVAGTGATFSGPDTENAALVVEQTLDRSLLWAAQTPQVFRAQALREALAVDPETRDAATDEAMLIEAVGGTVLIHPTPHPNPKVTTQLDLRLAELLLKP